MGEPTTPAGVETADGPQQLTPRHAKVGQAHTSRRSHHEVCYRLKAVVPCFLQGTTHCTEREPDRNVTLICVSVTCAPPVTACESQQHAESPPPPQEQTPPPMGGGGSRRNGPLPRRRAPYPPNKQQIHPTQSRKTRAHTDNGDIEKN